MAFVTKESKKSIEATQEILTPVQPQLMNTTIKTPPNMENTQYNPTNILPNTVTSYGYTTPIYLNDYINIEFIKKHDLTGSELHLINVIVNGLLTVTDASVQISNMNILTTAIECMKNAIEIYDWADKQEKYNTYDIVMEDLIFCSLCKPYGSEVIYKLPVWNNVYCNDDVNSTTSPYGLSEDILPYVIDDNCPTGAASDITLLTEIVTAVSIGEPSVNNICNKLCVYNPMLNDRQRLRILKETFCNESTYPDIYKKYYGVEYDILIKDLKDPLKVMEAYFFGYKYEDI